MLQMERKPTGYMAEVDKSYKRNADGWVHEERRRDAMPLNHNLKVICILKLKIFQHILVTTALTFLKIFNHSK